MDGGRGTSFSVKTIRTPPAKVTDRVGSEAWGNIAGAGAGNAAVDDGIENGIGTGIGTRGRHEGAPADGGEGGLEGASTC